MPSKPDEDPPAAIPVIREELRLRRESVPSGAVRVRVRARRHRLELPVSTSVASVDVERRPIGREVPECRAPWHDGDVLVIPVYEQRLVTRTVVVLVEEVRVRTRRERRHGVVAVDLRRDVAQVERRAAGGTWQPADEGRAASAPAGLNPAHSNWSTSMKHTVVALFDQQAAADLARMRLVERGVEASSISITEAPAEASPASADDPGVLASIRHFFADLFSGGSDDEMGAYTDAVRRGGAVLKVELDDEDTLELVRDELDDAGAVNIDERTAQWRQRRSTAPASPAAAAAAPGEVIPVVQESLTVGKRSVQAGGVRVYSRVVSEPVRESVALREERATVTRRAVDRPATEAELGAPAERTIEVTETVERPVVEKTARVVEEVLVGKEVRHTQATVEDTVRHTEVAVDELDKTSAAAAAGDVDRLDREDYARYFAAAGGRYEDYRPAYEFGRTLRAEDRYTGLSWDEVEPHARERWAARHPDGPWDRFKDAVQRSWERLTD